MGPWFEPGSGSQTPKSRLHYCKPAFLCLQCPGLIKLPGCGKGGLPWPGEGRWLIDYRDNGVTQRIHVAGRHRGDTETPGVDRVDTRIIAHFQNLLLTQA